jgi:acetaldehyde dehydrogenase/alcohol dehydrogenase
MTYPKYEHFIADQRYAEIARMLGLAAETTVLGVESLIQAITNLMKELDLPLSIQETGISQIEFERKINILAEHAFDDQDTIANPKQPLVTELATIYRHAYKG